MNLYGKSLVINEKHQSNMETGPPLNLSTSVKVEDCFESKVEKDHKLEIRNELAKHVDNDNQTYVLLQPVTDGSETLTITGEVVQDSFIESSKASISSGDDAENSNLCSSTNKNKTYRCSHCSETFQRATQLRTHEKTHIEDKVHECDQCPEIFSRLSLLVQHRQEHAKVYSCSECNLSLSSYTNFRLHMKNHKSERKFKCSHCSMSFSQQSHLITHLRKHTGEKPFICPMCSTRFKQVSHLTTHLRTHTNDRPYVCDLCSAAFSQTGSLKRHKRSHTGEKPFKCVECNAVFVEKRNLNRHLLSHSGVRPFKCDLCTVSFTQLIDLKRHTMSHSGIKPFKCDICEASFSRKNNLKWHKLTHEGDTPHICEICNVGFRIARDLKNHKRNHSENKPYSCNQCNSSFSQITTLKRHSLVHSGQKHFSCQECNAAFFEKSALKRHVQRHGNNKPFSCDLCLTSFLEARALKRHKIIMHSEGKYGDTALGEENLRAIGEVKVNSGIVKKLTPVADDENSLHIYEPVHHKIEKIEPEPDIPVARNEVLPHSVTSEIYINAINPQNASQQPTLVLTEPGKPPKTGRPANNCQNHNSHVHTLLEGSYNPWQTWCFCDPPNIPSQADSLEISSASSQPLILNSMTSPNSSQSNSQPLEFHTNDMLAPVLVQLQQTSVHSQKVTNNIHGTSSSLVTKGHFGSQVSNKMTSEVPQFSNSQVEYQSSEGYQHYSGGVNCTNDMSLIDDCPQTVNGHEQRIIENSQRLSSQGSKPSYLHMPSDEIISSSFSSISSHDEKQFSFEKEPSKIISQASQARNTIINSTLPAISKGELLNNSSHSSVIIVANESLKHCSQAQIQNSDQNNFAERPSQIASMNSNLSVPAYKEFSANDGSHEMNYQQNIQIESDHINIECTSEQAVGKTQNVVYEQLPRACDNKNQVTLQYSLTVNNPATGEIQIQSDLFSAKSPVSSDPKQKKKKTVKQPVAQDKKLNCAYCPKTFMKPGPLEMHIRTHTGEKPFICGICDQHFSHNNSLTIHMRSHTGERPYTCIYCGATFTQKSNLRVHHRTHTGEKPFKCNICEVCFSQGSHLKAHIRIHNNDRPFVCSICGQAFTQRSALKRHQMKHTGMKPHSCNECDSKFSQKDDLRRHQSNHTLKSMSVLNNKKKKATKNIKFVKDSPKATKHSSVSPTVNCDEQTCSEKKEFELNKANAERSTKGSEIKLEYSLDTGNNSVISKEAAVQGENSQIELQSSKEDVKRDVMEMEVSSSLKMSKSKPRSQLVEPSRISRRIKEAAERKKLKVEDSDFITGDLEEIDLAEEMENSLIKATQIKVAKKKDGNKKMYSDGVVQSWCFCEVPHGPNEPHTHVEASKSAKKSLGVEKASVIQEPITIVPLSTNVNKNEDYNEGALQFGLQQMPNNRVMIQGEQVIIQREQSPTQLSENAAMNSATTLSDVHIISSNNGIISSSVPSSVGVSSMPTSSSSLDVNQVEVNHLPVVEMEDGKAIYTSAQIISAQVLSGGQFITPDGTFYIEAGDIINNGTVVLNSTTPGTIYFDLGAEGQFVNVPVSVGTTTMGHDTQVLVPATTIVEGNNHVYSPSTQTVSIHSDANNFSDHIEATLLDNTQRSSSVFPNSINSNMLGSLQSSSEQAESFHTSQIENLQYTSLDNNELTLFNPNNVDFQTLTNVVVKQEKAKRVKKIKTSLPIVVNPCKCTVCGKVFAQKVTLRTHMEEVHKGLQYCGVCFDAFTSKEHLNTHKLQHQAQSFSCFECSLTFETKNALTQHKQKLHNIGRYADVKKEQRAFMCNQCDSRFYQRSDLKRHNLSHTGEKPFKCWQCGAGFTRKYSLKKHERIHTGEKPYNCRDCDQSFAYRHQYNRHLATHPAVEDISTDPNILAIPLSHVLS